MTNDEKAQVSILMPCFNAAEHLETTLESIINQTFEDWVLYVIDDASTDGSNEILIQYSDLDNRINVISEKENKGIISRRNQLLGIAQTEIACWADADDWYYPERIEKQVNFLESNRKYGAVSCDYVKFGDVVDQHVHIDLSRLKFESMILNNAVFNPGGMFRMSVIRKHNIGFDSQISGASDYRFWCEICHHAPIGQVNEPLVKYRIHSNQESSAQRKRQVKGHCETVIKNFEYFNIALSSDEVARLLIFPCQWLNVSLDQQHHYQSLALIGELKKQSFPFDGKLFNLTLLKYARAHVMRIGPSAIPKLFKLFGISWMRHSHYFGFELMLKTVFRK